MLKFAVSASPIFPPDSANPPKTYSAKCLEGVRLLKTPVVLRFHAKSGTKDAVLGLLEPNLWSLSAQCRLFQQAG